MSSPVDREDSPPVVLEGDGSPKHGRPGELISLLGLIAHPEGGYYREFYRSLLTVEPGDVRPTRAALTAIHFLLPAGERSQWHRVASPEVWTYLEGDRLDLFVADSLFEECKVIPLGPLASHATPVFVVEAGMWQAARSRGAYTLVACTVGPGFDFADFELLRDVAVEAELLRSRQPTLADLV